MSVSNETENLRSILIKNLLIGSEFKRYCFLIPSYQRGYRLGSEEIEKLLNDLTEFSSAKASNSATVGKYYCLQPIIVKPLSKEQLSTRFEGKFEYNTALNYYEVVDGQQRLTTIYIILQYLNKSSEDLFEIIYERDLKKDTNSRYNTLKNLTKDNLIPSTLDEQFFIESYKNIDSWIKNQKLKSPSISSYLTITITENTKIIWYELDRNCSDCYSVFRNINNGKIPLTDAELVKALLLNSKLLEPEDTSNSNKAIINALVSREQKRYARLWDEIQHALNNEQLWSFMTGNQDFDTPTRIDLLLELAVMKKSPVYMHSDRKLFTYYEEELSKRTTTKDKRNYIENIFEDIRTSFRTIQDWYDTPIFFNYIGMIMTYTKKFKSSNEENRQLRLNTLTELMKYYDTHSRNEFKLELMNRIRKLIWNIVLEKMGYIDKDRKSSAADTKPLGSNDLLNDTIHHTEDDVNDENDILTNDSAQSDDSSEDIYINYYKNSKDIEKWLMLFNILELNKFDGKFDFTIGKDGWSVEHIRAQHSEIAKADDWADFMRNELKRIENTDATIAEDINSLIVQFEQKNIKDSKTHEQFDEKLNEIMKRIDNIEGFESEDKHRLGNLALLSKKDNSAFNNSQFYEKRRKMLSNEKSNFPYATRLVFLKVYSDQSVNLDLSKWSKSDFTFYLKVQYERLNEFLNDCTDLEKQILEVQND